MFDELDDGKVVPSASANPPSPAFRPVAAPAAPAVPTVKAEDIFADVDKSAKPEAFRTRPGSEPPRGTAVPPVTGWKSNKAMVFILLFGGLVVVAGGGYVGLKLAVNNQPSVNNAAVETQPANTEVAPITAPAEVNNNTVEPVQPVITEPLDSDHDGLTDTEEAALGTDPNNSDTDQDGLTDREEVKVYNTDPLKADTDGDGYKDGDEVKNGYDPKGPGKLLEINKP